MTEPTEASSQPWIAHCRSCGVDPNDMTLWGRGYLAPEYEAYLVQRIAEQVAETLIKMAPAQYVSID